MTRDDDERADWWKARHKHGGKRHRKRRAYRKLKHLVCASLTVRDSYGHPRINLTCDDGKTPVIQMVDRDGVVKLWLTLERTTEQSEHDGAYTVERPVVMLVDRGRKIRLAFDDGEATVTVKDSRGDGLLDSFLTPMALEMTMDNTEKLTHRKKT